MGSGTHKQGVESMVDDNNKQSEDQDYKVSLSFKRNPILEELENNYPNMFPSLEDFIVKSIEDLADTPENDKS